MAQTSDASLRLSHTTRFPRDQRSSLVQIHMDKGKLLHSCAVVCRELPELLFFQIVTVLLETSARGVHAETMQTRP